MVPKPKFQAGDWVRIVNRRDPDYNKIVRVLSLSPSTKTRRSSGEWRYRLDNHAYLNESDLELYHPNE